MKRINRITLLERQNDMLRVNTSFINGTLQQVDQLLGVTQASINGLLKKFTSNENKNN